MKKILSVIICLITVLSFGACTKSNDGGDTLSIVVTAFPHYDFARQLTEGVDGVEINMLISPGSEVHSFEPTPSDIFALSSCDLFIYTGGESDLWAKNLIDSGDSSSRVISFMDICEKEAHEEHNPDSHEGHSHEYDEHVWTLPHNSEQICKKICEALCSIDSENSDRYRQNLEGYLVLLSQLDSEFSLIMSEAKRDTVIVADRFPFTHFANHYNLKYHAAYPGCSSSTEPSASVIAALSERVKNEGFGYVFTIEFSNGKIAKSVTEGTNAEILTLHSCHNVTAKEFEEGITYYDLMMKNAENLRKALCE